MDVVLALLLGLVVGLVSGAGICHLVIRRRLGAASSADPRVVAANHEADVMRVQMTEQRLRAEVAEELASVSATATELERQVNAQHDQYRELVDRLAAEQSARSERERTESRVLEALSPVQESLRTMQTTVTDLENQRRRQHGELSEQLRTAAESEERLRATAESLASALGNNATRGVWGETQLRSVVESAGLTNRVDFTLQSSIQSDAGAGRPDMVVHLPGGKSITVDAKVPYNSYLEASAIPATAAGSELARRRSLLAAHAKQVRSHVDALSAKTYWEGLDASPEFTIAFIPSESLLAAALEHDGALLDYAFSRRIALASPVNLWAVLKTVAFTWQQDVLTEDAKKLFDLGKELYRRLSTLSSHAEKLRRSIESTVVNYNQFAASLENRVLVTARRMDSLDESKTIPPAGPIEQHTRRLTQIEFELQSLDETGIGRGEFDGTGTDVPPARADDEERSAQKAG